MPGSQWRACFYFPLGLRKRYRNFLGFPPIFADLSLPALRNTVRHPTFRRRSLSRQDSGRARIGVTN